MQTTLIDIKRLVPNNGQIDELPKNPRFIRDDRFKQLVKSMLDTPEMIELRELIVYPIEKFFVVIAGNRRLSGGKEIGLKQMPCKVLPKNTSIKTLRAIAIKDNVSNGEHDFDLLANEWEIEELSEFGLELPEIQIDEVEGVEEVNTAPKSNSILVQCPECHHEFLAKKRK